MNQENIHALIKETYSLKGDTESMTAQYLLCCVLEIAKCDGGDISFSRSGYFWEKMDKALKEIGFEAIKKD